MCSHSQDPSRVRPPLAPQNLDENDKCHFQVGQSNPFSGKVRASSSEDTLNSASLLRGVILWRLKGQDL
jgi:hypothetical protein